ncbi:expressed unknown protein [Seminavis robusta]|uniref:Uncharacterized protein n=1 Tax=Seminavis robusta TaxID=568900 RepID=A0A9N8HX67_9STRA|nr:expressed unknown protein [Seminavis robusta]|eukprot:Sro1760_g295830.1 n/a (133) ;mRNA; r:3010-3408
MQVGIMAHSCVNLLARSMQKGLRSGRGNYVAQAGDKFISIGHLTHVGDDHIEYSVNTVPGCSGAPVFLLPEDQGDDDNYMKLIGIHAGFSDALGTNFGFLVAEQVEGFSRFLGWPSRLKVEVTKRNTYFQKG